MCSTVIQRSLTTAEPPADGALDPPVPGAQSCFLIRLWECENMAESRGKTNHGFCFFVFSLSEESVVLPTGRVLWWKQRMCSPLVFLLALFSRVLLLNVGLGFMLGRHPDSNQQQQLRREGSVSQACAFLSCCTTVSSPIKDLSFQ